MDNDLTTNEQSEALRTRIVTLCTYLPDAELTEAIDTMIASLRHNGGRFTYAQHATLTAMIKRLSVKRHMEKVQDANTGQDRESYSDTQDRESYYVEEEDDGA